MGFEMEIELRVESVVHDGFASLGLVLFFVKRVPPESDSNEGVDDVVCFLVDGGS